MTFLREKSIKQKSDFKKREHQSQAVKSLQSKLWVFGQTYLKFTIIVY